MPKLGTRCHKNHLQTEGNTFLRPDGFRNCSDCQRERDAGKHARMTPEQKRQKSRKSEASRSEASKERARARKREKAAWMRVFDDFQRYCATKGVIVFLDKG